MSAVIYRWKKKWTVCHAIYFYSSGRFFLSPFRLAWNHLAAYKMISKPDGEWQRKIEWQTKDKLFNSFRMVDIFQLSINYGYINIMHDRLDIFIFITNVNECHIVLVKRSYTFNSSSTISSIFDSISSVLKLEQTF